MGATFLLLQVKRKSCPKATLKSIRRIPRAWSTRFDLPLTSAIKRMGWILKEGKEISLFPFEGNEGLPSLPGEMCATARTHLLGEKRATARPLLLQWSGMCEGAAYGKAVPSRLSHLRSASRREGWSCFDKKLKVCGLKISARIGWTQVAGHEARGIEAVQSA